MYQKLLTISFVCVCLWGRASRADAITIGFDPAVAETTGQTLSVDLVVLDLGNFISPSLGAFDLTLTFDPGVLSLATTSFGSFLGNPATGEAFVSATDVGPGSVNLVGLSFLTASELNALQPSAFPLATLNFNALAVGETPLLLTVNTLSNEVGESFSFVKTETGSAQVIPEPATLLLLGMGLFGVAVARRRQHEVVQ